MCCRRPFDLFQGVNLNLNFPSVVGKVRVGDREVEYGYSSGIYTKYVSAQTPIPPCPRRTRSTRWAEARPSRIGSALRAGLREVPDENVTWWGRGATAGVFGRYLHGRTASTRRTSGRPDHDPGERAGDQHPLRARADALYGPVAIREIYGATEGMFGQQLDETRRGSPTTTCSSSRCRSGVKMLHEMRPGEMGSLVVSTPVLLATRSATPSGHEPPYFRCIGRDRWHPTALRVGRVADVEPGAVVRGLEGS